MGRGYFLEPNILIINTISFHCPILKPKKYCTTIAILKFHFYLTSAHCHMILLPQILQEV